MFICAIIMINGEKTKTIVKRIEGVVHSIDDKIALVSNEGYVSSNYQASSDPLFDACNDHCDFTMGFSLQNSTSTCTDCINSYFSSQNPEACDRFLPQTVNLFTGFCKNRIGLTKLTCVWNNFYTSNILGQVCICTNVAKVFPGTEESDICNSNQAATVAVGGFTNLSSNISTVEVQTKNGEHICLKDLPENELRIGHTMDGNMLCGGLHTRRSCLQLNYGNWTQIQNLREERYHHSSWKRRSGDIVLLGGRGSLSTSEIVDINGSTDGFELRYQTDSACSISFDEYVIVTGGIHSMKIVSVYMANGWVGDLPSLNFDRHSHACGHYYNDNDLVYLVTGGEAVTEPVYTSEILVSSSSSWTSVENIPSGGAGIRGLSFNNRILISGGEIKTSEVYEFDKTSMKWNKTEDLQHDRHHHSFSLIPLKDIKPLCTS